MASTFNGREPDHADPEIVLRILRIAKETQWIVRMLPRQYGGLFVHYKGRSIYCPGPDECQNHKLDRCWKGYCACESWDRVDSLWIPWVLEITESLELDFRGKFDAGQVWLLSREADRVRKKPSPVVGRLLEERDPATFPAPFDIRPVLMHFYHTNSVQLNQKNPLPERTILLPSKGLPPVFPSQKSEQPTMGSRKLWEELRKKKQGENQQEGKS
jgi:hypothetical protein